MILTVTLNPAIDKFLVLKQFSVHKLHRLDSTEHSIISAGGKGVNIAVNLKALGNEVIATGFAGGHSGHLMCDQIRRQGITTSFIFSEGLTRTNISILDQENETLTGVNAVGQNIQADDVEFFLENYLRLLHRVSMVVIAGSLPMGITEEVYGEMIRMAREKNLKVVLHTSPNHLDPILDSSPYMIIPDMRSYHELMGKPCDGIPRFLEVGRDILQRNIQTELVVFTHRIENVVAITREQSFILRPKNLQIVNMLGYADAYLSGIIHADQHNFNLYDALCYASAAGLTNVESINKELENIDLIEKNVKRIEVEEL